MEYRRFMWSKDDTLKLIKMFKGFPFLWNTSLPDHRDKGKRAKAITKIANEFITTVPEVQRKLHNLRCSFNQEIRRLKNKNYVSSWEYFESMSFVAGQHKRRSNISKPTQLELRSVKNEDAANSGNSTEDETVDANDYARGTKRTIDTMMAENECPTNNNCNVGTTPNDDFETFGKFVGAELRGISCQYKREDLKRMILQSILTVTDIAYVSPSLSYTNSNAFHANQNQNSPSLQSIISLESVNDSRSLMCDYMDDHDFHLNNVKVEMHEVKGDNGIIEPSV